MINKIRDDENRIYYEVEKNEHKLLFMPRQKNLDCSYYKILGNGLHSKIFINGLSQGVNRSGEYEMSLGGYIESYTKIDGFSESIKRNEQTLETALYFKDFISNIDEQGIYRGETS